MGCLSLENKFFYTMCYYINKILQDSFTEVVKKTKTMLKDEGFGVISEIDIHDKLKEKLNVDFRKYKILGACNPSYAYEALKEENKIGTMLPCNVIVQEVPDGGVEVAAVDPIASMQAIGNENLAGIAMEIKNKLSRVIQKL